MKTGRTINQSYFFSGGVSKEKDWKLKYKAVNLKLLETKNYNVILRFQ